MNFKPSDVTKCLSVAMGVGSLHFVEDVKELHASQDGFFIAFTRRDDPHHVYEVVIEAKDRPAAMQQKGKHLHGDNPVV